MIRTNFRVLRCAGVVSLLGGELLAQEQKSTPTESTGQLEIGSEVAVAGQPAGQSSWIVSVTRGGAPAISGRVTVPEFRSMIKSADLTWRVDGAKVMGSVLDENGKELASFEGTVRSPTTLEGTFTARDGSTGSWSWEGTLSQ